MKNKEKRQKKISPSAFLLGHFGRLSDLLLPYLPGQRPELLHPYEFLQALHDTPLGFAVVGEAQPEHKFSH